MAALLVLAGATAHAASIGARDTEQASTTAAAIDPALRIQRQLEQERDGSAITEVSPPPRVTARSWLVYDDVAHEPIAARDAGTSRPIASLAKLMTALIATERIQPDELVTIPASINDLSADASRMDARAGEKWPAADLLRAMLVYSANDAALALATHVAGSEQKFVTLMNDRADELGLEQTEFASATGLDTPGTSSTSTPIDLVALTLAALDVDEIRSAVAEEAITLKRPGGGTPIKLTNRNPLLGSYEGVDGVKTGFTDSAGYMLVVHDTDDASGGELVVTTFASTSEKTRMSDMRALLDWARPLRSELLAVEGGTPVGAVPVQRSGEAIEVFVCDDLQVRARVGQRLIHELVLPRSVAAPVAIGDEVGELRVRAEQPRPDEDAPLAATVPICSADAVPARSRTQRAVDHARDWRGAWSAGIEEVEDAWSSLMEVAG